MPKISVVAVNVNNPQIKPLRLKLGKEKCTCYGMISPLHKRDAMTDGVELSGIPYTIGKLLDFVAKIIPIPNYIPYMYGKIAIDWVFARQVAMNDSSIVYINPLFYQTAKKAKNRGKKVVVMAGNSEPEREYRRVVEEYKRYCISHGYIFANKKYVELRKRTFAIADNIITISKVSEETYRNAGYNIDKLKLIPLTGTDFPRQSLEIVPGKQRAFISTAFHSFIKGTHRLLLAWKKADIRDIPLILVGNICEDLQEFIKKYGPFENVIYAGHQNVREFYNTRDAVGVQLSLSEGAVRVTPEMMSFGFPMITSPDATCDLIQNGKNGFIVDPFDEAAIIGKLRFFAEDWSRVYAIRQNVIDSVKTRTVKDFSEEVADYLISIP